MSQPPEKVYGSEMLDGVYLYNISIKEVNLEGAAQPAL